MVLPTTGKLSALSASSGKRNGRVDWKVVGGWWEGGLEGVRRLVGGWWEGGGRIVGGVVVALGFLSSCNGDLRDWLVLPQRSQVSFRVERGPSGFLLSHCP